MGQANLGVNESGVEEIWGSPTRWLFPRPRKGDRLHHVGGSGFIVVEKVDICCPES
jgi:hypothetical protein